MSRRCFTWFLISGLGKQKIYQNLVGITRMWGFTWWGVWKRVNYSSYEIMINPFIFISLPIHYENRNSIISFQKGNENQTRTNIMIIKSFHFIIIRNDFSFIQLSSSNQLLFCSTLYLSMKLWIFLDKVVLV